MTAVAPPADSAPAPDVSSTLDERVQAYSTNVLPTDYTFDPTLSLDENYLVLTLIYARVSMSKRGNMACIIVDPSRSTPSTADDIVEPSAKRPRTSSSSASPDLTLNLFPNYPGRILSHSNNFPLPVSVSSAPDTSKPPPKKGKTKAVLKPRQTLFQAKASNAPELHAETRSICLAAAQGIPLAGATAYISFPPCAHCLPLLVATGIKRLVYRQVMLAQGSVELCKREGVECVEFTDKAHDERLKEIVGQWWKSKGEGRDETRTRLERWWAEQERLVQWPVDEAGKKRTEEEAEKAVVTVEEAVLTVEDAAVYVGEVQEGV